MSKNLAFEMADIIKSSTLEQKKQQRDTDTNILTQAKDRAQLTATTSMSIVHVALLKAVLDMGPDQNEYYTASIIMIITALILQIICGALSLFISQLQSFYSKHGTSSCEECCDKLLCCFKHKDPIKKPVSSDQYSKLLDENQWATIVGHDHVIIEMAEEWEAKHTILELRAAEANVQVQHLGTVIAEAKMKLQALTNKKEDTREFQVQFNEIQQTLKEANEKKDRYTQYQRSVDISTAHGKILADEVEEIRKSKVLRTVSHCQHILNYMFYVVFVLNAIITGFGIAGGTSSESSTNA